MPYVDGYEYDFFLSYAHADDEPVPLAPPEDRWVGKFYETLNYVLRQELGGPIHSPWKDGKIPLHRTLDGELVDTVRRSAILLVVLSPSYVHSDYCALERAEFLKSRGGDSAFVIVVEKQPVESLPPDLPNNLRFKFYDDETQAYYGHPLLNPSPDRFYSKLVELSSYIKNALDDVKKNTLNDVKPEQASGYSGANDTDQAPLHPPSPMKKVVFLAQTDMEEERDSVRDFLHQHGVHVVPGQDYPQDPEHFCAAAQTDLQKADAFVQLLSGKRGPRPAGLEQGYAMLQWDLARARADLPILQWRPGTLNVTDVADPHTRTLLAEPTVIVEPLLSFQQEILRALQPKPEPPPRPAGKLVVFVNADEPDTEFAKVVAKIAKKNRVKIWHRPREERDPGSIMKEFETRYQTSDGVALIYGSTSEVWVNEQVGMFWRYTGGNARPLPLDVFNVPPPDEKVLGFEDDDVTIHDCYGDDPAILEKAVTDFLDRVRETTDQTC